MPTDKVIKEEKVFNTEEKFKWRWDQWFDEKNSESCRRTISIPIEEQWLFDAETRIENNGHTQIVNAAKLHCSSEYVGDHRNRITDFSGWLFSLDHPPQKNTSKKNALINSGKIGEKQVQYTKRLRTAPKIYDSNWTPLFIDDFTDNQKPLKCSSLLVNNAPIYGKPDYLYFNEKTKTALIVEVKTSSAPNLPIDSWPNLRAQLWAYGHLDIIKENAKEIILIGEIWEDRGNGTYYRRKTYQWNHSNTSFRNENEELFHYFQEHASH